MFLGWEIEQYHRVRAHFVISTVARMIQFYLFFLGPALTLPFVLCINPLRRPFLSPYSANFRLLPAVFLISTVGLLLPTYYGPTYAAALVCLVYAFLIAAMQSVRHWSWHGKKTGLAIVRAVPVLCFLMLLIRAFAPSAGTPLPQTMPLTWASPHLFNELSRAPVQAALEAKPGLHLALVRYRRDRARPVDWVQNFADIDTQKVIWAHDMGPQNEELLRYFKDRHVWLVEPDKIPPRISPYPAF